MWLHRDQPFVQAVMHGAGACVFPEVRGWQGCVSAGDWFSRVIA